MYNVGVDGNGGYNMYRATCLNCVWQVSGVMGEGGRMESVITPVPMGFIP